MDDNVLRFGHRDPEVDARVESLLGHMTLEEKVGQMVQINPFAGVDLEDAIRKGDVGTLLSVTEVAEVNRLQRVAVEESRLGIPLIIGNDVIHGHRTIFPIPLAEACTWEP